MSIYVLHNVQELRQLDSLYWWLGQERRNSSVLTIELRLFSREYLPDHNSYHISLKRFMICFIYLTVYKYIWTFKYWTWPSDWKLLQKFGFESDCTLHAKYKVNAHQEKACTSPQSLCKYQLRDQPFFQFWSHNYVFKIKNWSTLGMPRPQNLSLCWPVWANFGWKRNPWSK